jgi:hypothetical protein
MQRTMRNNRLGFNASMPEIRANSALIVSTPNDNPLRDPN